MVLDCDAGRLIDVDNMHDYIGKLVIHLYIHHIQLPTQYNSKYYCQYVVTIIGSLLAKSTMNIYKMCQHQVKFAFFVLHHVIIHSICATSTQVLLAVNNKYFIQGIDRNPCCEFDAKNITKFMSTIIQFSS